MLRSSREIGWGQYPAQLPGVSCGDCPGGGRCAPLGADNSVMQDTPDIAAPPVALLPWSKAPFMRALGPAFHTLLPPQPLPEVHWVHRNTALAADLGLTHWLDTGQALHALAGNTVPPGTETLAGVYSGHQFGVWAGQLGDGRALLLGELDTPTGAMELQLKGSGRTPYSRMGDGRAVLRSSIREYLCSEAMHALGIPTTRALAIVGSPQPVVRETMETAAVVTRVAPSFIRFGHFEHFAHTARDVDALRLLTQRVIERWFPELAELTGASQPAAALLREVTRLTAELMAQWQAVGFCHGVMNTDNLSILGLTIDYGPFGFLDAFDPLHVCNHSDDRGRYAYARQPAVAYWNLHALAQALVPLVGDDTDALRDALEPYGATFEAALQQRLRAKLGLRSTDGADEGDAALVNALFDLMAADHVDFTILFRRLAGFSTAPDARNDAVRDLFIAREAFDAWAQRYTTRLQAEGSVDAERALRMNAVNPKYILRNHLAETAIVKAGEGDFSEVALLAKVLRRPYDEQPEHSALAAFPPDWAQHLEVSCSS
jgi:serine/tyrosine/threonine adenylyltransferase